MSMTKSFLEHYGLVSPIQSQKMGRFSWGKDDDLQAEGDSQRIT